MADRLPAARHARELADADAPDLAALGRVVSHSGAIQVTVTNGAATLLGQVLPDELSPLLDTVSRVRGIQSVENRLEICESISGSEVAQQQDMCRG